MSHPTLRYSFPEKHNESDTMRQSAMHAKSVGILLPNMIRFANKKTPSGGAGGIKSNYYIFFISNVNSEYIREALNIILP